MKFSYPKYGSGISKLTQVVFGGYNHTRAASEGEIYDMQNLTSDDYPILSARKPRALAGEGGGGGTLLGYKVYDDYICEVSETVKGKIKLAIGKYGTKYHYSFDLAENDSRRRSFTFIGDYMVIMPDKKYIKLSELGGEIKLYDIEVSISGTAAIGDGTYGGMEAKANTITFPEGTDLSAFSIGDAVTISGCIIPENNKTPIIEEIDGNKLIFLEYCFTIPDDAAEYTETNMTVARLMPDIDYICEHGNRLFGCKGDTIYCSRLGNPFVWNAFEGSSGSWTADVGSPGDFTGCISYGGYVYFFKEECIYKLYGTRPSNFQLSETAALGVKKGSGNSFGIAGDILFYHSRLGIMAYSGGIPQNISSAFGDEAYSDAVGGSDGVKYYVSMKDASGGTHLFVYDTRTGLWIKEDDCEAVSICFDKRLYFATADRCLYALGNVGKYDIGEEEDIFSFAEFGDFYCGSPNKKIMSKLYARLELEEGASVTVKIKFDSEEEWKNISIMRAEKKRSYTLPIAPRRCDHFRIRIEGLGIWRLYSLSREGYIGSEK